LTYQAASNLATNPGFLALSRPLQARFIKDFITEARKVERLRTLSTLVQDPELRAKYIYNELSKRGYAEDLVD